MWAESRRYGRKIEQSQIMKRHINHTQDFILQDFILQAEKSMIRFVSRDIYPGSSMEKRLEEGKCPEKIY